MALKGTDVLAVYRPGDALNYKTTVNAVVARVPAAPTVNDSTITITAAGSLTGGGIFTTNDTDNVTINLTGPDISSFINAPATDGSFVIVQSGSTTSYSDTVDGGEYAV
jgi:hypothetical protein